MKDIWGLALFLKSGICIQETVNCIFQCFCKYNNPQTKPLAELCNVNLKAHLISGDVNRVSFPCVETL